MMLGKKNLKRKNREGEKKGNWLEGSRLRPMRTAWV